MVKRLTLAALVAMLLAVMVSAQSAGTFNNLVLTTDSNGYLLVNAGTPAAGQISAGGGNLVLTTTGGNLNVAVDGGTITPDAITLPTTGTIAGDWTTPCTMTWTDAATDTLAVTNCNVGIGTATPGALLEVTNTTGPSLRIMRNDVTVIDGEVLGNLEWYSNEASSGYAGIRAKIAAVNDHDAGNAGGKTNLAFSTTNGAAASLTEALRIDELGNVGIGTTTPSTLLDVRGPTGTGLTGAGITTLATKELTVVDGDSLGCLYGQAPLESDGTDAILVGGAICFEADGTFDATSNPTEIVFKTAASETATEVGRWTKDGELQIGLNDTSDGLLYLYGDTTSSTSGGHLLLFAAADHDTTINYYDIKVLSDDLTLGPVTDTDSLLYDGGNNDWNFTGANGVNVTGDLTAGTLNGATGASAACDAATAITLNFTNGIFTGCS